MSRTLAQWEQSANRAALAARLADPAAIERFIAEVRGNPATGHMGRDQLTAFTVWKLELEEKRRSLYNNETRF